MKVIFDIFLHSITGGILFNALLYVWVSKCAAI